MDPRRLPLRTKLSLTTRILRSFIVTAWSVRKTPLPAVIAGLDGTPRRHGPHVDPRRLGRVVGRVLDAAPVRARCLHRALVLYELCRAQGDEPTFVVGLPERPVDKDAHAWIEVEGRDVGPPPGRAGHVALARYPEASAGVDHAEPDS